MIEVRVKTPRRSVIIDITREVQKAVESINVDSGLCHVFVPHTTAGITINENADPDVKLDMIDILEQLVPYSRDYHHMEGNSDSHVKASMMGFSITVVIENKRLRLGQWQGIQFCEFDGPRTRRVEISVLPFSTR